MTIGVEVTYECTCYALSVAHLRAHKNMSFQHLLDNPPSGYFSISEPFCNTKYKFVYFHACSPFPTRHISQHSLASHIFSHPKKTSLHLVSGDTLQTARRPIPRRITPGHYNPLTYLLAFPDRREWLLERCRITSTGKRGPICDYFLRKR